jgi:hypothetical protein
MHIHVYICYTMLIVQGCFIVIFHTYIMYFDQIQCSVLKGLPQNEVGTIFVKASLKSFLLMVIDFAKIALFFNVY